MKKNREIEITAFSFSNKLVVEGRQNAIFSSSPLQLFTKIKPGTQEKVPN